MKGSIRHLCRIGLTVLLMADPWRAMGQSVPYVPESDALVLADISAADGREAEFRGEQREALAHPGDLPKALHFARQAIKRGSEEGDPHYFGYAQSALGSWWGSPSPPAEVRLLRATILQWQHQFAAARRDLDALIAAGDSGVNQARLIRATVELVQGEPSGARHDCVALIGHVETLIAATCIASVNGLTGDAAAVAGALSSAIQSSLDASMSARIWAWTELAEIYMRLGESSKAEYAFTMALDAMRTGARDPYLLASYADFLLDQGRPRKVIELLGGLSRIDNLLLRLTLAENTLAAQGDAAMADAARRHGAELERRFAETRERGEGVHQREEAIFLLGVRGEAEQALAVARSNWRSQRELIDARVLLEAAGAAGRPEAARDVTEWLRLNGIHDRRLEGLAQDSRRTG